MCPSASKDDFRQCWILLCIQSLCITLIQWLDNALQHVNLALLFNSTCSKTHCVKKTLVTVSVLQSKHRHSASLKKESSSSFLLIILTQLSDKVDRRLAPMMNEGHDIRRPVGRYNVSKNWRSTALLNRALEAFQFMLAGDFQRGGQVVDSCAFWLH